VKSNPFSELLRRDLYTTIELAGKPFNLFEPIDPEIVLNALDDTEYNKDEFLPYWAELWPSARVFSDFLLDELAQHTHRHVVELGTGLGLTTLAVAASGKRCITLDYAFAAGYYTVSSARHINPGLDSSNVLPVTADWRSTPLRKSFSLIVGSDILYEKRWCDSVQAFISKHLSPKGIAFIADPGRKHFTHFKNKCILDGLSVSPVRQILTNEGKTTIHIIRIEKPA